MQDAVEREVLWMEPVDGFGMLAVVGLELQQAFAEMPEMVGVVKLPRLAVLRIAGQFTQVDVEEAHAGRTAAASD